jgi:hypothetical protein
MSKKTFELRKDGSMLTPEFRVSFPKLFEPDDNGKYGLSMIFDNDVNFSVLEIAVETKKKETWPKGTKGTYSGPILDGNESQAQREELTDKFYINGKAGKYRPGVVDQNLQEITDEAEFYPGCWARAVITVYSWTYMGKCGVSVNVRNVQKIRDDEPLISRVKAEDEFSNVAEQSTEDL